MIEHANDHALIRANLEGELVHLELVHDPLGTRRGLLRSGPWVLSHLERDLSQSSLALLRGLDRALEGGPRCVVDALGASARLLRTLPPDVRVPVWPLRLRSGGPGGPWPFDPETAALELSFRALVKRETFDARELAADAEWLRSSGLSLRIVQPADPHGRRVLFAARHEAVLDRAVALEQAVHAGAPDAARELGTLLGYPRCCVDAFTAIGRQDDATLLALRAGDPRPPRASASSSFLLGSLALVSHVPCRIDCPATLAIAERVRDALVAKSPSFDGAWRALATTMQMIDASGRAWILDARDEGERLRIERARELRPPGDGAHAPILREAPELAGRLVDAELEALDAVFVADHRARTPVGSREP